MSVLHEAALSDLTKARAALPAKESSDIGALRSWFNNHRALIILAGGLAGSEQEAVAPMSRLFSGRENETRQNVLHAIHDDLLKQLSSLIEKVASRIQPPNKDSAGQVEPRSPDEEPGRLLLHEGGNLLLRNPQG